MAGNRVTIRDIAKEAGVSISVVSYVLNNVKGKSISKEVQEKIRDVAERLNYVPNRNAAILRSGKSYIVGIVSYWNICDTLAGFIHGIKNTAESMGYRIIYYPSYGTTDRFDYLNDYNDHLIDGVVFIAPCESIGDIDENEHIKRMLDINMPFTVISEVTYGLKDSIFLLDYYSTTYLATEYFINQGEKRITYISARFVYLEEKKRLKGYLDCMNKYGLEPEFYSIDQIDENIKDFHVVVTNKCDTAHALYALAYKYGVKIPDSLKIISSNTEIYTPRMLPPITSVEISGYDMGEEATKCLLAKIENKEYVKNDIVPKITIRGST